MPRKPIYESDSPTSSSENESLSSSSSSSSLNQWSSSSFTHPTPTSHYLSKVQSTIYELVRALACVIDGVGGGGGGWLNVRVWMRRMVGLSERWIALDGIVYERVVIAAVYITELLRPYQGQLNDKSYTSRLDSESFKSMIVVFRRLWPSLSKTPLFAPTPATEPTNTRIPSSSHEIRPYLSSLSIPPTIISRFLALTLDRPGTRYENGYDVLDLSDLGLGGDALSGLNWGMLVSILKGWQAGVDWRDLPLFLVNLSRNGLQYLPKRLQDFGKRIYALDISSNPLVGLPDWLRSRAFDVHNESTLRVDRTSLKDFTIRKRYHPPSGTVVVQRGAAPLGFYAIKRIYQSEADRREAVSLASSGHYPVLQVLQSAYECEQCQRLLIDVPFFNGLYVSHPVVQLSPSGLAFGGRKCIQCVGTLAGLWPLFTP